MTIHETTLQSVLRRYSRVFEETRGPVAAHLWSMLERFPPAEKSAKRIRWLAFIQGALWCAGLLRIEDGKRDMYRVLHDGEEPPEADGRCEGSSGMEPRGRTAWERMREERDRWRARALQWAPVSDEAKKCLDEGIATTQQRWYVAALRSLGEEPCTHHGGKLEGLCVVCAAIAAIADVIPEEEDDEAARVSLSTRGSPRHTRR